MVEIIIQGENLEQVTFAFWIAFGSFMATLFGIAFAVYKYFNAQKQNTKLDFVKQIEYYEEKLTRINETYYDSQHRYNDCRKKATYTLVTLDRISYLREKNLLNQTTIQFFQYSFGLGISMFDWYQTMEGEDIHSRYPYFFKIKDTIEYNMPPYRLDGHFKKQIERKETDPTYDPFLKPESDVALE